MAVSCRLLGAVLPVFSQLPRRTFLSLMAAAPLGCVLQRETPLASHALPRLFFVTGGKTVMMRVDGSDRRPLQVEAPHQVTWQPSDIFPDGKRVILLSMEARRDGPGRPFSEYYTQTPTHLWIHDLDSGALEEIAYRDRLAVFYTPQLLLPEGRILVQVVKNQVGQVYSMNLDGSDAREFTRAGEGLPYGFSLSPSGKRVAFHLAGSKGYEIWTSDTEGGQRTRVAGDSDHLYFAPQWSPDGAWLAFADCLYRQDPGHDGCDVRICRPDGREARNLTEGQAMWFAATYGNATQRGGGSNVVHWTPDGALLFSRRTPGARVAWEYQVQRPDTDHFNRDFKPDQARGGTQVCRLDPRNGSQTLLTPEIEGQWDFRGCASPEGDWILFCRAHTRDVPSLWSLNTRTGKASEIAANPAGGGVDHPRWISSAPGLRKS